jgi:hypothetical protein
MKKQIIATTIILLFIGVAVAPSINFSVVKASDDNDLVEVTTEACGIKGYRNTTVKLTKEQYQNLGQYLVDFRARLNQTSTREEAVPIFKEAVVELDKYGLLPKGMSVEKAQKIFETLFNRHHKTLADNENLLCLIAGRTNKTYIVGALVKVLWNIYLWFPWPFSMVFYIIAVSLADVVQYKPFFLGSDISMKNAGGWIWTLGLLGVKTWSGTLTGIVTSAYWNPYIAAFGFTGIKILMNSDSFENFYLGYAIHVKIDKVA